MADIYLRRDSRTREVAEAWGGPPTSNGGPPTDLRAGSGGTWSTQVDVRGLTHSLVTSRQLLNLFMCIRACASSVFCVLVLPGPVGPSRLPPVRSYL